MGFPVALTRGGSQSIDLMVGDVGGTAAISLQVKTATMAWRNYRTKPAKSRWEWDVGPRSAKLCGEAIFYAFVDLNGGNGMPTVFIVPSAVVATAVRRRAQKRRRFALRQPDAEVYREAWHLLTDRLAPDARLFDHQDLCRDRTKVAVATRVNRAEPGAAADPPSQPLLWALRTSRAGGQEETRGREPN
jgi:hypothetical protein